MNFWLMKSEPDVFSIDDLFKNKKSGWEGVRNYQARNFMRDQMNLGDLILFYHSSCDEPGIAGIAKVSKTKLVDPLQFEKSSEYYDPKSKEEDPRWIMVEVEFVEKFKNLVSLKKIKETKELSNMMVIQKGSRLSINPVDEKDFFLIKKMAL